MHYNVEDDVNVDDDDVGDDGDVDVDDGDDDDVDVYDGGDDDGGDDNDGDDDDGDDDDVRACRVDDTWTCHKSHFGWKFTGTVPYANPATPVLRKPVQSKMHMDMSQEAFVRKFIGKMPDGNPAARIWCEPAQSKCIWTCHKRHLCGNL